MVLQLVVSNDSSELQGRGDDEDKLHSNICRALSTYFVFGGTV